MAAHPTSVHHLDSLCLHSVGSNSDPVIEDVCPWCVSQLLIIKELIGFLVLFQVLEPVLLLRVPLPPPPHPPQVCLSVLTFVKTVKSFCLLHHLCEHVSLSCLSSRL